MIKLRKITSLLLVFCFIFVAFSSLGLDIGRGYRAEAAEWTLFGVNMGGMKSMHSVFGYIMLGLAALHGIINIKPIINYIKRNKEGWIPSKAAAASASLSAIILALALAAGNARHGERMAHFSETRADNAITYYDLKENNNRPSQY